ncbi:MAG TPA: tyrosine-type recombinase/integrase [Acidimicrobiales bacterium]|nr:tyrosine-type recombinase/integrase [Acidimicrobiales bacterium]
MHRKGGNTVTIPLAPRTARAVDLAVGKRFGLMFLGHNGERLTRDAAPEWFGVWPGRRGSPSASARTSLRHSFITAALHAGVPLRDVQEAASHADPRTTMRYDRARQSLDRHATYIVATFVAGSSRGDTTRSRQPTWNGPLTQPALRNPRSGGRRWAQRLGGDRQIAGYLF